MKFEYKADCDQVNLIIESTSAASGNPDEDGSINDYHHNDGRSNKASICSSFKMHREDDKFVVHRMIPPGKLVYRFEEQRDKNRQSLRR